MKPHCCLVAIALLLTAGVYPAQGQTEREGRPYRGLFGSGVGESEQSLTANGTLAGGYDDNILARGFRSPRGQRSGILGQGSGSLSYSFDRDRVQLNASAGRSTRYYPSLPSNYISSESGSLGLNVRVLNTPSVTVHQMAAYRPYSFGSLLPSLAAPAVSQVDAPDLDQWITQKHYFGYTGGVTMTQPVSRRGTVDLNYDHHLRRSTGDDRELVSNSAGGGYTLNLSKGVAMKLGYTYRVGRYSPNARRLENHNIDVGVDYSRSLSISRRTSVGFSTGTSGVSLVGTRTDLETAETTTHDRTRFHVTGSARITREIGRTWSASGEYTRGLRFSDQMDEPVYGDVAALSFGGLLSRRLQFQSNARALFRGRSLGGDKDHLNVYVGSTGLSMALTRFVSLGLNYSYYRYGFEGNAPVAPGLAPEVGRQSVRASVNLWAPLFNRERSANVTR